HVAPAMALLDPYDSLFRIEMLLLQTDCLGDPRAGVEARLANQQLWVFETGEYGGRLIVVEDTLRPNDPFPSHLYPRHGIRECLRDNLPLLAAGKDSAHDIPQVYHHVPGRALVLEPVENLFRAELSEALVLPSGQDVVVEAAAGLLP